MDSRAIGANPGRPGADRPVDHLLLVAAQVVRADPRTGRLLAQVDRPGQQVAHLQVVLLVVLLVVLRVAAVALRVVVPDPRSEWLRRASCCHGLNSAIKPITRLLQRSSFL